MSFFAAVVLWSVVALPARAAPDGLDEPDEPDELDEPDEPDELGEPDEFDPLGEQRAIVVGDRVHRTLEVLATDAGVVLPMPGGPYPVARARALVRQLQEPPSSDVPGIFRRALPTTGPEAAALAFVLRSFALVVDDGYALQLSPFFGPEVYARRTPVDVGPAWDLGFRERQPPFGLDAQARWRLLHDVVVQGRATFDLRPDQNLYRAVRPEPSASNVVPFEAIDVSFPHRALASVGGRGFVVDVGRDRLTLGNGRMGNLVIGDSADHHDFVRAQLYGPAFTWTSLVLRLDPLLLPEEVARPTLAGAVPQKHLVVHRVDVVFGEKLRLAVTEGWMVGGVPLDVRHLNPLLIFHNLFPWNDAPGFRSASVVTALEATLVPVRGLRLWAQGAANQLQVPWELERFPDAAAVPNATGAILGGEATIPLPLWTPQATTWVKPAGVLHGFAGVEYVETSPWFGVRENPLTTWSSRRRLPTNLPGADAIVERPLGWRFGPDSRVLRAWAGVLDTGLGDLELGVERREQGEQTLRTPYAEGPDAVLRQTPSGIPSAATVLTLRLELLPLRWERVSATVRVDWRHFVVANANHVPGRLVVDDQLALGVRLDL